MLPKTGRPFRPGIGTDPNRLRLFFQATPPEEKAQATREILIKVTKRENKTKGWRRLVELRKTGSAKTHQVLSLESILLEGVVKADENSQVEGVYIGIRHDMYLSNGFRIFLLFVCGTTYKCM